MKPLTLGTLRGAIAMTLVTGLAVAGTNTLEPVSSDVIDQQRQALATNTKDAGFGPQAPRDIGNFAGSNELQFGSAPASSEMNLCNIHMHTGAEHKGGEFTTFAGNGNGKGYGTGFNYNGQLTDEELAQLDKPVGMGSYGTLQAGDTIEVHYVHTSAQVQPGPTLGACLSESVKNPQLRVETQIYVVVSGDQALDFMELTEVGQVNGKYQALNIPTDTGVAVQYTGSTTGPAYNEVGSPFQVSWSVRPEVLKVDINSVGEWFNGNLFNEDHAHAVRNLVVNPTLLSPIAN
jgi:hypothetical protein